MFELSIERAFCAAHAILLAGEREIVHGHNWHVRAVVSGRQLDDEGLLCDFHAIERHLDDILDPFRNADLNRTPPFDRLNPTAEQVARHVADTLDAALRDEGGTARVCRVSVTEAPGCTATYLIEPP